MANIKISSNSDTIVKNTRRDYVTSHLYMGSFERVNGLESYYRVHTPAGYWDSRIQYHHWYLTDRLGSTVAVIEETGKLLQRNGYFPSGTPYLLPSDDTPIPLGGQAPTLTNATDRLHIGNRYLSHVGLDWYDNTARMHDPLLMRFTSPDPLASKYPGLSPWAHTAANPVNLVDPSGKDYYELNNDGTFSLIESTDDNFHIIQNSTGDRSIQVDYSFFDNFLNLEFNGENGVSNILNIYSLSNNGVDIFEFLAENSDVEWSRLEFENGISQIGTLHEYGTEGTVGYFLSMQPSILKKLSAFDHSHTLDTGPSGSDVEMAKKLYLIKNTDVRCRVFKRNSMEYINYNRHTDPYTFKEFIVIGKKPNREPK